MKRSSSRSSERIVKKQLLIPIPISTKSNVSSVNLENDNSASAAEDTNQFLNSSPNLDKLWNDDVAKAMNTFDDDEINPRTLKPKRVRKSRSKSLLPARAVRASFKKVLSNLDDKKKEEFSTPSPLRWGVPRDSKKQSQPNSLLGSILKVLCTKTKMKTEAPTPLPAPQVTSFNDGELLQPLNQSVEIPEIKSEIEDCMQFSEVEEPNIEFDDGQPESTEHVSEELTEFISSTSGLPNGILSEVILKIEREDEDPLNVEMATPLEESSEIPNFETYAEEFPSSQNFCDNFNVGEVDSATTSERVEIEVPPARKMKFRQCRICCATFSSADALIFHLYRHIPIESWGSSSTNDPLNVIPNWINPTIPIPAQQQEMEELVSAEETDPLSLAELKTESETSSTIPTEFPDVKKQDLPKQIELRYPNLCNERVQAKSPTRKGKGGNAPNPKSSLKTNPSIKNTMPKSKAKLKNPPVPVVRKKSYRQYRDGSNCPYGFEDVVQKLVLNGGILK